jgi:FtsH-binding integral membrane protein
MKRDQFLIYIILVLCIIVELLILCVKSLARTVPINYILLSIFTACEAYIVAHISSRFTAGSIAAAAFMTAGMVITLTVYAFRTTKDFTMMGGSLYLFAFVLFFSSLILLFLP